MANITVSIPEDLHKKMRKLDEVNWSAVCRNAIEKKLDIEQLQEQWKTEEKEMEWAVRLGRKAKKGRAEELRKQGYDI